ncbi:hypothetical protein FMN50_23470 [Rhodobacterales bacterium]|nr:hypothetical protein FMN50_23470 [Rhodobacterales bacterium]
MRRYTKPIHLPKAISKRSDSGALALINVVFLLLMFLLIAGTLRPTMPEDFAWAETTSASGTGDITQSLALTRTGELWFEGRALSEDEIADVIERLAGNTTHLSVQVDKRTRMEDIAGFAERVKAHGVQRLTLVTVEEGKS